MSGVLMCFNQRGPRKSHLEVQRLQEIGVVEWEKPKRNGVRFFSSCRICNNHSGEVESFFLIFSTKIDHNMLLQLRIQSLEILIFHHLARTLRYKI